MEQPWRSVRAGRLFAGDLRRGKRSWGASTIPTFPRFHARQRFARNRSGRISWQPLGTWKPCFRCFRWNRGVRWYTWNRDFVAFVGNVGMRGNRAFVGIVGTAQKKFAKSDQKSRAKGHTAAPAGGVVSWSRQKQTGRQGPRKGWLYDRQCSLLRRGGKGHPGRYPLGALVRPLLRHRRQGRADRPAALPAGPRLRRLRPRRQLDAGLWPGGRAL